MPTTDELYTMLTDLTVRVNQLDGQNLTDPTLSNVAVLTAAVNGLKTDLKQVTLTLERLLMDLNTKVTSLQNSLNSHLNQ